MKSLLYSLLIGFYSTITFSQNIEFKSANFKDSKDKLKQATDAIERGDELLKIANEAIFQVQNPGLNFQKALSNYLQAQAFNPNNGELNFKIGVCYANSTSPSKCIEYLKRALSLDPTCDPFLMYYLGYAYQLEEQFDDALKAYETFETTYKKADNFNKFVSQHKDECVLAKTEKANPKRVWVDNVSALNSEQDDIAPSITTDGSELIFSSNRPNEHTPNEVGGYDFDIYNTTLNKGKWSQPKHISGQLNSSSDDVANTLSYDGTKLLMHRDMAGQYDIFESKLYGEYWSAPVLAHNAISTNKANEKFAAYSADGWSIFFSRDNDTRSNGFDIMASSMMNKMQKDYMAAVMQTVLNSKFDDGPVYLHIDGETMYLASAGNGSIGGYDIFVSKKVQGSWTKPVNLGYPINTPYDDFFFSSTANGKYAYINSNRAGGKGGYDVYKVTFRGEDKQPLLDVEDYLLASVAAPMKDAQVESQVAVNKKSFTVFKGITLDALTKKAVESTIDIIDNASGKIIESFLSNSATGKFIITLPSGKNYGIAVKADKYLFHSENFDIPTGSADNLVNKSIELNNIAVGSKIELRNIFFDLGKSTLRPESNTELDRLVKLMKDAPGLKIELSGHTDNTGSATINQTLSQARAEAVVNYLISKGVAAARMTAKGYGSAKPIADNKTEEGRQQNRRTEFEIKSN